ncbi:MAG: mandelate racemase/muconate lactonizing enzyme family protein [Burkholderiaceae bacterium]|nr:mandelate racemase/muconate lactonizing enzyme family protein [Burkholderiaceae bacterium]
MKVTSIETVRLDSFPNILWVRVHTDEAIIGLGETFYGSHAAESHIHQMIAPYLIGKDPRNIESHQAHLVGYLGFCGSGAEVRGRSAIDIALWDILGKSVGLALCDLLGGKVRNSIKAYNTCAGYSYVQTRSTQGTANFGLDAKQGKYEDLQGFLTRADEVAHSLLEMGITAMKIWPFDYAAEKSAGQFISAGDLKKCLEPFEKIRKAVGDRIDVMAELHSMWNRPMATRIARALEQFDLLWVEDPVTMDHMDSIGEVARSTTSPIAVGETRGLMADYRYLLDLNALSLLIMDMSWCGGVSEARKIANMASTYHTPVAFHDCSGPVVLAASTHLALHTQNCFVQEMVRAFYYGWYGDVVDGLPKLENGQLSVSDAPGIGVELRPEVLANPGCRRRVTTQADL